VITVSGELSMHSIKSQFRTNELWLSRVTLIILFFFLLPTSTLLRRL
jgi:hypothetical protein